MGPNLRQPDFGWEDFKEVMRKRFYPEHIKMAKYEEFLHLRQGNRTIQEYYAKFLELARFAPAPVPDELSKARKFINGLNFETQKAMCVLGCQTLNEAYNRATSHYHVQQIQRDIHRKSKRGADEVHKQGDKRPNFTSTEQSKNFQEKNGNRNGGGSQNQRQGFMKMN